MLIAIIMYLGIGIIATALLERDALTVALGGEALAVKIMCYIVVAVCMPVALICVFLKGIIISIRESEKES